VYAVKLTSLKNPIYYEISKYQLISSDDDDSDDGGIVIK